MSLNTQLQRNEHRLLALMLFCLLAATFPGNSLPVTQGFLIAHFGFFLLWQPVVKQQQNFSLVQLMALIILVLGFIYWFNPWLNTFWYLILLTLLSGRIFARGMHRLAYGLAVITLFLDLVMVTVPGLFQLNALASTLRQPFEFLLLALPLPLLFLPARNNSTRAVDFVRGFLFVMLLVFLLMASVLISLVRHEAYLQSLVISIGLLSLFLLLAAFLWSPRGGFAGFARLWEKYLLNLGGPFEQWVQHVDALSAETTLPPEKFLSAAGRYLLLQHWICGVAWNTGDDWTIEGQASINPVSVSNEQLQLRLYAYTPVGPVLLLHAKLFLNVLAFYYRARLHEQLLTRQAHMRAIYETGSKLTHDVKNILQSTRTMTQIINDDTASNEEILHVLKKQMPLLAQRLTATLEKLKAPAEAGERQASGSLLRWWQQLQRKYGADDIAFVGSADRDREIPLDIFNTISENLLENARNKRAREGGISIRVQLSCESGKIHLSVTDTGSAVRPEVAELLFRDVVPSHDGFGIGLYQCQQLARKQGYTLRLENNRAGDVRFSLIQT